MSLPVALLGLSTARPPFDLLQDAVVAAARRLFDAQFPGFERMAPVFRTAGIRTRQFQLMMPLDWYLEPRSWPERTAAYLDGATDLFIQAAEAALAEAGVDGGEVDAVVTISSTGIATPSLEARAMARLGLRRDVARVPVFGLGCAGGATGLALAARLARSEPGATVLLVAVELCSLAFRPEAPTKADIVATALFGDGAAACVLRAGDGGFAQAVSAAEHTRPDTLDIMGHSPVRARALPAGDGSNARRPGPGGGRRRPFHLPPRRHEGDRGAGGRP